MRKNILNIFTIFLLMMTVINAAAVPARKKPVTVIQPDGTSLTIIKHGDEFHHWVTDINGQILTKDSDGYYKAAERKNHLGARKSRVSPRSRMAMGRRLNERISIGSSNFLVVLVEFSDLEFSESDPAAGFNRLMNEKGYTDSRSSGSAYDYYSENSDGKFAPEFDVVGPVKLSRKYSYYGGNDSNGEDLYPDKAFFEACGLIDDTVDFKKYDHDGDGYVDNIFFFYAGHNESEYDDEDTIWPHAWSFQANYEGKRFDGVQLDSYACTSEFSESYDEYGYSTGSQLCGIGAFCHEFCHVLGLPDFYDIDYDDDGSYYEGPQEYYDIMASGSFLADGKAPPYISTLERVMLGWRDEPEEWKKSGDYTFKPVEDNFAYKTSTSNEGEYFIYEARSGKRWDSELEPGLLVYHIDKSSNKVGKYTARELWENWEDLEDAGINSKKEHPCMLIVCSYPDAEYLDDVPFPGYYGIDRFDATTKPGALMWDGTATGFNLSDIRISGGTVSLHFENENDKTLGDYGFCYIKNPTASEPPSAGNEIVLELDGVTDGIALTKWSIDGAQCTGKWIATSGKHVIRADNTYSNGKTEIVEMTVSIK